MSIKRSLSATAKARFLDSVGSCALCGYDVPAILEVHHIVPLYLGGIDTEDNLTALCPTCHAVVERLAKIAEHEHERNYVTSSLYQAISKRLAPGQHETLNWLVTKLIGANTFAVSTQKAKLMEMNGNRINAMVKFTSEFMSEHEGGNGSASYHRG
jgi:hypothetical protein